MESEVLEETSSESPHSNLNAFFDQIFREKQESGGNRGNSQIQPPHGGSKKNATQFFLCAQTIVDKDIRVTVTGMWRTNA
jgi:hypothetical protein